MPEAGLAGTTKVLQKGFRVLTLFDSHLERIPLAKSGDHFSPPERALAWICAHENPSGGVRAHTGDTYAYPEVTGYLVPTLLKYGQQERAIRWSRWLVSIQNKDGSWSEPWGGVPYTFDTGQVLKGLVAVLPRLPEAESAVRIGADWLVSQIKASGEVVTPDKSAWRLPNGRFVSDKIHLYSLEPLRQAGKLLNEPRYLEAVDRAVGYYLAKPDLIGFDTLSHFHAYVIEALVDLGFTDLASKSMSEIQGLQKEDGSIPAYPDVVWPCSTGTAQYAVIWFKLGQRGPAESALSYLTKIQNKSGGFYGSYGRRANYFADREISWAVKFFLDAYFLYTRPEESAQRILECSQF